MVIVSYDFRTIWMPNSLLEARVTVVFTLHARGKSAREGPAGARVGPQGRGTAVVDLTRSMTKLVLQSCTLGCLSSVFIMKRE